MSTIRDLDCVIADLTTECQELRAERDEAILKRRQNKTNFRDALEKAKAEIARLREERDQARAEAMALRDALECWIKEETCDCPERETHSHLRGTCLYCTTKKALATPSAGHLRAHDEELTAPLKEALKRAGAIVYYWMRHPEGGARIKEACVLGDIERALGERVSMKRAALLRAHDLSLAERAYIQGVSDAFDEGAKTYAKARARSGTFQTKTAGQLWQQSAIRASLGKEGA